METNTPTINYEAIMHYGKFLIGDKFSMEDPNNPRREKLYQSCYRYFAFEADLVKLREKKTRLTDEDYDNVSAGIDLSSQYGMNQKKGIMLIGDMGVGKSILFKVMNLLFKTAKITHAKRGIERDLKELGEVETLRNYGYDYKNALIIDDVGTEETEIYHYKNKISIVGSILLERYELYQDQRIKTHITTNRTTAELLEMYGPRNYDRFKEMFQIISWTGASMRL